jgi:phosphoribosylformylglycinamidine (FGAM) synthase-like amidotransferase family enzyme
VRVRGGPRSPAPCCATPRLQFISKNVFIRRGTGDTALTNAVPDKALKIPIAHGEGRYHADADTLKALKDSDRILFRYCDEQGKATEEANPNGSKDNIAGVCNKGRNVFGMMPHPERACDERLGNTDGRSLFEGLLKKVVV